MIERTPARRRATAAAALTEPAATLAGYTIGVTADGRKDELAALLEARGARVVVAPALRIVPIADDAELRAATRACLDTPPDVVLVNTGIGMRGWLEAADGWGLSEPLRPVLARAYLVARGPKARAAVRTAGLQDHWSPEGEGYEEVVEHLIARGIAGRTVAMQLHGESQPEYTEALRSAGARVIEVPVYRWAPPTDTAPLHRLVDLIVGKLVDAVTFTSAAAVQAVLRAAGAGPNLGFDAGLSPAGDPHPDHSFGTNDRTGPPFSANDRAGSPFGADDLTGARFGANDFAGSSFGAGDGADALLDALRTDVLVAGVGPVTAAPLRRRGVPVFTPARARLSALVRTIVDELPQRAITLQIAGHSLTLRGHAAIVDGELRRLAPGPMAVLRALATSPGRVLSRAALLQALPRGADEHAVEMAVARLRAGLALPGVVQTVVKRGYRIPL